MKDGGTHDQTKLQMGRRGAMKCLAWAGTGVLWTVSGGIPRAQALGGAPLAEISSTGFSFVQISDSHIGFDKPANPDVAGTLRETIAKIQALPVRPAFAVHTGDITHLSKPAEFDQADQILKTLSLQIHAVPGEHDFVDDNGKAYLDRYGKGTKGMGWYSFDAAGVHFIALVNVADFKPGGLGNLGDEQIEWLENDVKTLSSSTPIVVFAHMPLWTLYAAWGWGTDDAVRALSYLRRFGSVTVLNGHIHQIVQKVEGNITFHTAMSTAYPQPAPGTANAPGPLKVPTERLRSVLGVTTLDYRTGAGPLALTDRPLTTS